MTRIAIVADLHASNFRWRGGLPVAGINARCALILKALSNAIDIALAAYVDAFVIAGDVFDNVRPEPQIISCVQKLLEGVPSRAFLLVGNHDQVSAAPGDHALGPLAPVATIADTLRAEVVGDAELILCPYGTDFADLASLPVRRKRRLIVAHTGISDSNTPAYLAGSKNVISTDVAFGLCRIAKASALVSGDWHSRKLWTSRELSVMQIGSLCPVGFQNPGFDGYGTVAIWNSETGQIRFDAIPGPRFIIAKDTEDVELAISRAETESYALFVSYRLKPGEREPEILKNARITGYEAVADESEVERAEEEAGEEARAERHDVGAALAAFVESMPVPADVGRPDVLAEASVCLGARA